jgi:ligand-binding SRPBCC domain-containing protein
MESLTNVTGIGMTVEPVGLAAGEEWHGRFYIDHARFGSSRP